MFYDLDFSFDKLTLFYTEPVLLEQFIPHYFEFHSSPIVENSSNFQLSDIYSISFFDFNRSAIIIELTIEDLNHIKNITVLATSIQNTFISQIRGAVTDFAGNEAISIDSLQPLQVQ